MTEGKVRDIEGLGARGRLIFVSRCRSRQKRGLCL
jgi:hypothetical protein